MMVLWSMCIQMRITKANFSSSDASLKLRSTIEILIEILSQMKQQSACQKNTETSYASSTHSGMIKGKLGKVFSLMCTLSNSNVGITYPGWSTT